jgi:hypothetical protein
MKDPVYERTIYSREGLIRRIVVSVTCISNRHILSLRTRSVCTRARIRVCIVSIVVKGPDLNYTA